MQVQGGPEATSMWLDILAVDPARDEIAVTRRVVPDFAPFIAIEIGLFPVRLAGDIERVDAAGAASGHLQPLG